MNGFILVNKQKDVSSNFVVQEIKKVEPDNKIEEVKDPPNKKVEEVDEKAKPLELKEEVKDEISSTEEPLILKDEVPSNGSRKNNLSKTLSPSVRKLDCLWGYASRRRNDSSCTTRRCC